ncbi:MAG: aspartate kinase, partial [Gemmatimonadota bacterium]
MTGLVILKFGGLSLASPDLIRLAAARIAAWRSRGPEVVAVVSASGHTTDRILAWLGAAAGAERSGRESDKALATGEQLAAALVAAALSASDCPAVSLSGAETGLRATGGWGAGHLSGFDERPIRRAL